MAKQRNRRIRPGDTVRLRSSGKYAQTHTVKRTRGGLSKVRIHNDTYVPVTHRLFERARWEDEL